MSFILSTCICEADGHWGGSRVLMSSAYGRKMALKPDAANREPLWQCAGLFCHLWAEWIRITWWRHLYFPLIQLFFLGHQGDESRRVVAARHAATQSEYVLLHALRQQGREQTRAACGEKNKGCITALQSAAGFDLLHWPRQTNGATFHLVLLRIHVQCRSGMVVNFEPLHQFESNQVQTRILKLLDGAHFVHLHHYLLLAIHLEADTQQQARRRKDQQENQHWTQNIS